MLLLNRVTISSDVLLARGPVAACNCTIIVDSTVNTSHTFWFASEIFMHVILIAVLFIYQFLFQRCVVGLH